jgi:UDP-glucose 4-epimerase
MTILVIGSKGFIGSHTVQHLQQNNMVYGCDVLPGDDENYFQLNADNTVYENIFMQTQFDICINCSGAASVPWSMTHPLRDFELNTLNVFKILESISRHQPQCKFLNLSSAAVYGNPEVLPIKETSPVKPLSPYGWHKHYAEQVCREFTTIKKIPTCSIRIFSAYGEGLKKQLFWDLYQKCKGAQAIDLFGTGNESRDFIYIRDLTALIELLINKAPFNGECINAANGQEVFLKDAVKLFCNIIDKNLSYQFSNESRPGDPLNWCADIFFIRELGYHPAYSLEQGLANYIAWLRKEKL